MSQEQTIVVIEKISLFCTEGSADKEYHVHLKEHQDVEGDNRFSVMGYSGKRGAVPKPQEKTKGLVSLEEAQKIYQGVIKEKKKKYTEDTSGRSFVGSDKEERITGFKPMLLNPLTPDEALALVKESPEDWVVQVKHNGERRALIVSQEGKVTGVNRQGLSVTIDQAIAQEVAALAKAVGGAMTLDGEDMGTHFHCFDIVSWLDNSCQDQPLQQRFVERLPQLQSLLEANQLGSALSLSKPLNSNELEQHLSQYRASGAEGLVIKKRNSVYVENRPNSGGDWLKIKFWETATVRVGSKSSGKNSVAMQVLRADGSWRDVGFVTVPASQPGNPEPNTLLDVTYLYAHRNGALVQPIWERVRTDLTESAASEAQLKYHGETFETQKTVQKASKKVRP